jgi:hypothetical protein
MGQISIDSGLTVERLVGKIMKTNSVQFIETFKRLNPDCHLLPSETRQLHEIADNHLLDLTTNVFGYFDEALRLELSQTAAQKLAQKVEAANNRLLPDQWQRVVEDYHRNGYWGLKRHPSPPSEKPQAPTPARQVLTYIWVFVQAGIFMKAVVLYFGLNAASEEDSSNSLFLYLALAFSFISMGFFAWRLHKKE